MAKAKLGWGPTAAGLLLVANVVVPLLWGDVYPFTSAPMFRDAPCTCCNYRVYGPDGKELVDEDWLCHRVYDGNPIGYGVGIEPPAVLEQSFGDVHDEAEIAAHIQRILSRPENSDLAFVDVVQDVIGPVSSERVGVVESKRFRVTRR